MPAQNPESDDAPLISREVVYNNPQGSDILLPKAGGGCFAAFQLLLVHGPAGKKGKTKKQGREASPSVKRLYPDKQSMIWLSRLQRPNQFQSSIVVQSVML